jgi:hypothetical protein
LIVLVTAFDALGLPFTVLQQILLWLPNLVVALVVLVIAGLAPTPWPTGAAPPPSRPESRPVGGCSQVAVWSFAIVIAVN